jgi:hypothetical protein
MKTEDPEIARMLRDCQEPPGQRYALVLGLLGAFAAGGVVFVAITRSAALRGGGGVLLAVAILLIGFTARWRKRRGPAGEAPSDELESAEPTRRRRMR